MSYTEINFGETYTVEGMRGIAFRLRGYATETVETEWIEEIEGERIWCDDRETVEDRGFVRAVMVGDDREHIVDVDDLTMIADEDFCPECGSTGCGHYR